MLTNKLLLLYVMQFYNIMAFIYME